MATRTTTTGAASRPRGQSVYETLGVRHVINATGTVTILGGSLMPPEVIAAWADAARHFVNLVELQDRVGERIANTHGAKRRLDARHLAAALERVAKIVDQHRARRNVVADLAEQIE